LIVDGISNEPVLHFEQLGDCRLGLPNSLIQGVQHLGDAGLLRVIRNWQWRALQDSLGKATTPTARRSRSEFLVSEVQVVKQIVRVQLFRLPRNQGN
jgi:hypothetical protein